MHSPWDERRWVALSRHPGVLGCRQHCHFHGRAGGRGRRRRRASEPTSWSSPGPTYAWAPAPSQTLGPGRPFRPLQATSIASRAAAPPGAPPRRWARPLTSWPDGPPSPSGATASSARCSPSPAGTPSACRCGCPSGSPKGAADGLADEERPEGLAVATNLWLGPLLVDKPFGIPRTVLQTGRPRAGSRGTNAISTSPAITTTRSTTKTTTSTTTSTTTKTTITTTIRALLGELAVPGSALGRAPGPAGRGLRRALSVPPDGRVNSGPRRCGGDVLHLRSVTRRHVYAKACAARTVLCPRAAANAEAGAESGGESGAELGGEVQVFLTGDCTVTVTALVAAAGSSAAGSTAGGATAAHPSEALRRLGRRGGCGRLRRRWLRRRRRATEGRCAPAHAAVYLRRRERKPVGLSPRLCLSSLPLLRGAPRGAPDGQRSARHLQAALAPLSPPLPAPLAPLLGALPGCGRVRRRLLG